MTTVTNTNYSATKLTQPQSFRSERAKVYINVFYTIKITSQLNSEMPRSPRLDIREAFLYRTHRRVGNLPGLALAIVEDKFFRHLPPPVQQIYANAVSAVAKSPPWKAFLGSIHNLRLGGGG